MKRNRPLARLLVVTTLLLLALALTISGSALSGDLSFTLTCSGFVSNGSELVLDRDNTGQLSEAFIISAIDGAGRQILEPVADAFFVGTSIVWEAGEGFDWDTPPNYNPLTMQIVSPAGNGLEEQVVYQTTGTCEGLPRFSVINVAEAFARDAVRILTGEAFVLQPADGETSESVAINAAPPRPINPPGLLDDLLGYAVVNTDNLFLRSGDSPRYSVIAILDGGTELAVLGRNEDRTWWYVQVGGLRGWSSSEFLVLRGDLTDVQVVPVAGEFTQPRLYVGFTGNPLYALPIAGTASYCALPGNLEYAIVGRTAASDWYQIEAECDGDMVTGWMQADRGIVRNPSGVSIPVARR